jgi:hypothetical protein
MSAARRIAMEVSTPELVDRGAQSPLSRSTMLEALDGCRLCLFSVKALCN